MKIEIDTERLEVLGLDPNQFVFLYNRYKGLTSYISTASKEALEVMGYGKIVKDAIDGSGFELREKAYALFEVKDSEKLWYEFKSSYPVKDGTRRLHDDPKKCEEKYIKLITKDPTLHARILKGLRGEQMARVAASKTNQFFPSWKAMPAWLNQMSWEKYVDYNSNDNNPKERTERAT